MSKLKVANHSDLERDLKTNAILTKDRRAFKARLAAKKKDAYIEQLIERIDLLEKRLTILETKINCK